MRTFIALDFETTGLDPVLDEVLEIGAVRFTEDGELLGTFEQLAKPFKKVPRSVSKIHGITAQDVAGKPSPEDVWSSFLHWAAADYAALVSHNAEFEVHFIRAMYSDCSNVPQLRFVDTLQLSRNRLPNETSYKLVDLVPQLKGMGHRALPDASACAELMVRLARTYKSRKIPAGYLKPISSFPAYRDPNLPTEKQLNYIRRLGGDPGRVSTKKEAGKYIDALKPQNELESSIAESAPSETESASKGYFWVAVGLFLLYLLLD